MNENAKAGALILGFALIVLGSIGFTVGTLYRDKITSECKLKALDKSLPVVEIKELCG
jgi:hypothetical protein